MVRTDVRTRLPRDRNAEKSCVPTTLAAARRIAATSSGCVTCQTSRRASIGAVRLFQMVYR
jgi:hypothetical protein